MMLEIKLLDCPAAEDQLPKIGEEMCVCAAYDGGRVVGHCFFRMESDTVVLSDLVTDPKDFVVADGLGRAVINYAGNTGRVFVRTEKGCEELDIFAFAVGLAANEKKRIEEMFFSCGSGYTDGMAGCEDCPAAGNCAGR